MGKVQVFKLYLNTVCMAFFVDLSNYFGPVYVVIGGRQCPLLAWWLHFMACLSVSCACHIAKYPKLRGFKQQGFIFSQFRRPEDLYQGVVRAILPLKALAENPPWPLAASGCCHSVESLGYGSITPISACILTWPSSRCVSVCPLPFF